MPRFKNVLFVHVYDSEAMNIFRSERLMKSREGLLSLCSRHPTCFGGIHEKHISVIVLDAVHSFEFSTTSAQL